MKYTDIVLVDYSDCSASALKFAKNWSLNTGGELIIINQLDTSVPGLSSAESERSLINHELNEGYQKMEGFLTEHLKSSKKPKFLISPLSLPNQIENLNKNTDHKAIIFVGLKSSNVLKRIFIGSETINIIENSNNIIIAIPKGFESTTIKSLKIAISEDFNLNHLELNLFLKQFSKEKPNLDFFNLSSSGKTSEKIERLFSALKEVYGNDYKTSFSTYEFSGDKVKGIKELFAGSNDQLLVLQKGTRYFSDHIFRKFLINELVYDGKTPLVVLP